eukprot:s1414_g7.t1
MSSNTLVVRTVTLVAIFSSWISPRDRCILDGRVQRLELISNFFKQILSRTGLSLHAQSLHFVWGSAVQALWLFESAFFPEQDIQTSTSLTTRAGDPSSFLTLVRDDSFRPYVELIHPTDLALQEFFMWLDSCYTRDEHIDIFNAISDSILILENLALAFQLDVRSNQPIATPAPIAAAAAPGPIVIDETRSEPAENPEETPLGA